MAGRRTDRMLWMKHAFTEVFEGRRDELTLEPRRFRMPVTERHGNFCLKFSGLPLGVQLGSDPPHRIGQGKWIEDRYYVDGLRGFAGDIILRTTYCEWRIPCDSGQIMGQVRLSPTAEAQRRLDQIEQMWLKAQAPASALGRPPPRLSPVVLLFLP